MAKQNEKTKTFDRALTEGPIRTALWKLAWPTMLQNIIAGLQGIIDHTLVGHLIGRNANAAIGVSWQIFLVVIVFISSLFSGMGVLVARFAGAGDTEKVHRVVYQAFITAVFLACFFLAPIGYFLAPQLLNWVHAAPEVKAEALPYIRIMFVFSFGMLIFFMLGGALRAAGDSKTPLRLGVIMTVLNLTLNFALISGLGPIPSFGTRGSAMGTAIASGVAALTGLYLLFAKKLIVQFPRNMSWKPDWQIISSLFKYGLPTGFQGIAMNVGGVIMLRFIGSLQQSAAAHAAYAVGYTQLFSLITWTSVGLMGATAAMVGQNLGAGKPERSVLAAHTASRLGFSLATVVGLLFMFMPQQLLAIFGMKDSIAVALGVGLLRYLSLSGLFVTVALVYNGALQGTGDTRSPLFITLLSQFALPIGLCSVIQNLRPLQPSDVWLAIVLGHATRALFSFLRFRQEKWRTIKVEVGAAQA